MKRALSLSLAAIALAACAREARAQWPRVNEKLKARKVIIRKAVLLPAQVAFNKVGTRGPEGGTPEADQIGAQQALQQFALPRTNAEGLRVRPRDMPENGHARVWAPLFDHARQQGEMIILDQHDRICFAGDFVEHGSGEFLVDSLIGFPIGCTERRPRVRDMTEWPQAFIREAKIEPALLFLR